MAALNTDKFRLVSPNTGWQLDASGISDASVTSFGLVSATSLPTATGVTLTVDRINSSGVATPTKMERIKGVVSGSSVISCVRGTGGTAQAHAAGAVVEIVIDSTLWNDLINGILTFSTQLGKLLQSAVDSIRYAADAGGDDTYSVTLDPVPAAYYAGMEVNFKPTTANTGACTLDVNGLGAKSIKKNVSSDLSTGDILSGQMVKVLYDGTNFQLVSAIPPAALNAPQGFLTNGKIVPSVASNNLTVALKTLAGTDPSATDPIYVRIGDTIRTVSAATSVTKNAGTNWCNAGSAELATKEIDYFVYLSYSSTDAKVFIQFSRKSQYATQADWGAAATTSENTALYDTAVVPNISSSDIMEVVGRFAATLSAGAGYTWSVPTFTAKNLIQRPIFETRTLEWIPTFTGFSTAVTCFVGYKLIGNRVFINFYSNAGTSNATTFVFTLPFTSANNSYVWSSCCLNTDNGSAQSTAGRFYNVGNQNTVSIGKTMAADGGFTASGAKAAIGELFLDI